MQAKAKAAESKEPAAEGGSDKEGKNNPLAASIPNFSNDAKEND
jgi:hypothetical protein